MPIVLAWHMNLVQKVLQLFGVMRCSPWPPSKETRTKQCAWQKRPASRDLSDGAVRQPIRCRRLSVSRRRTRESLPWNSNKSSLHDVMQNRRKARSLPRTLYVNDCLRPENGGAGRDRTDDILLAKQALSQLSYGP